MKVDLHLTDDVVEAIAQRAAAIVLEQLGAVDEKQWASVPEAAEFLRCKPQRIYELRSSGRLTPFTEGGQKGGRAMIAWSELRELGADWTLASPVRPRRVA